MTAPTLEGSALEGEPLSVHLRTATRTQHEEAEGTSFIGSLMAGDLDVAAYADLAAQHHAIYSALEAAEPFLRADRHGARLVFGELPRVRALEADLTTLVGPSWRDEVRTLPATERYAARLRDVAGTWVGGYAAHAYTRYLGDLSGGLAVKAILQRTYRVPDEAVNFYTFPGIAKPKLFKDEYRRRLDALPLDTDERERVADEARTAFRLNTDLFRELAEVHLPTPQDP
ncbi:biliverdin-producing heme oxygenase [Sanguibacter suaedae]|uniref:Biliverdin-producing heme oxygenase n=1 Tax=Sanguibacter suaedae TaxID=2795737 RepID=A0A934I7M6_9MICO|nr:biliverdin-producing heme oxygenase [Sanguibacter suaedae]MBI9113482.1 biliverdin-producing heme oxygenase [Sanguibacter suaedae]